MAKREIDWEAVELDYRAGIKTLRVMAEEHGVSHVSIQKRATKNGWARDLQAKIKQKTEALVTKMAVTKEVTSERVVTENAIVTANAEMRATVLFRHRKDFERLQSMCESMSDELEIQAVCKQEVTRLAEIVAMAENGDKEDAEYAMKVISKTLGLSNRADTFKKLIDAKKTLVALEREVMGIDERVKGSDDKPTTYNMTF